MKKIIVSLICCLLIASCSTKLSTRYYSLQALPSATIAQSSATTVQPSTATALALPADITLGISTIKMPSMLNRQGIVSHKTGSSILIASHDIWAGKLKADFTRVLAELLADKLGIHEVVTEPWNTRFRPLYQLQLDVKHFSGTLGGIVRFKVNWILSGNYGQQKLISNTANLTLQTSGQDYQAYVSALNTLLATFTTNHVQSAMFEEIYKQSVN